MINTPFSALEQQTLRKLKFIPVYKKNGFGTDYIEWFSNEIFTRPNSTRSESSYYVLNEKLLEKYNCERILGVRINEMNHDFEVGQYLRKLRETISRLEGLSLYSFILTEFQTGRLKKYECLGEISELREKNKLPLKNRFGKITTHELFIGTDKSDSFYGSIIPTITVHRECRDLAIASHCKSLSTIYYGNLDLSNVRRVTGDDIETFEEPFFEHSKEIISELIAHGYVDETLIEDYCLQGFATDRTDESETGEFPNDEVIDLKRLNAHIEELYKRPKHIKKVERMRSVDVVEIDGKQYELNPSDELRKKTMQKYQNAKGDKCFCQMCQRLKENRYIEVNNLELNPQYYWAEMRIALCLECSKRFKDDRSNKPFYSRFLEEVKTANPLCGEPITIDCLNDQITFTQTHLAEIQQIFRLMERLQ